MSPTIESVEVVPVAGYDSMLLNLSGAHGPFFTRNVVIITDSDGRTGLGEVPGGEAIRSTIEEAGRLLKGKPVARFRSLLRIVAAAFLAAGRDPQERLPGESPAAPRRSRATRFVLSKRGGIARRSSVRSRVVA